MPEESKEQLDDAVASGARAWEFKGDGLGMSDGHGTFRYYRNLGQERLLKFKNAFLMASISAQR